MAKAPGWAVVRGGKHVKAISPSGRSIALPSIGQGRVANRAILNNLKQLRHEGLDLRRQA